MEMKSTGTVRTAKTGTVILSALLAVLGILFVLRPETSAASMICVLGIVLAGSGVFKMIGYYSRDLYRLAFQYDFEIGILLIVIGAVLALRPIGSLSDVCIGVGAAVTIDALFKVRMASDARKFGLEQWRQILIFAVITGITGIVLMIRPGDSIRFMTILLGISLLAEGMLNLYVALRTVRIIAHQLPDTIDADYEEHDGN